MCVWWTESKPAMRNINPKPAERSIGGRLIRLGKQNDSVRKAAFNERPCRILGVYWARLCCWIRHQVIVGSLTARIRRLEEEIVTSIRLSHPAYVCTYTVVRRSICSRMLDNPSPERNIRMPTIVIHTSLVCRYVAAVNWRFRRLPTCLADVRVAVWLLLYCMCIFFSIATARRTSIDRRGHRVGLVLNSEGYR